MALSESAVLYQYKVQGNGQCDFASPRKELSDLEARIDFRLILQLCHFIVDNNAGVEPNQGGILVFLPGWTDIRKMINEFENDREFRDRRRYAIIPLHSLLPDIDQHQVDLTVSSACRKLW